MSVLKVLILEDDPLRMVAFRKRMEASRRPHEITHHTSARSAIADIEANRYDLILLDHDLGGRTFVDFTNEQEDCGMRVAEWFSIRPERVRHQGPIVVHSLNGPAAQQMVELIGEASWVPFLWSEDVWRRFLNIP